MTADRPDADTQRWRAEIEERQASHIQAVLRAIAADNVFMLAQLEALWARLDDKQELDDEADRARLAANSAAQRILLEIQGALIKIEGSLARIDNYLDTRQLVLERLDANQILMQQTIVGMQRTMGEKNAERLHAEHGIRLFQIVTMIGVAALTGLVILGLIGEVIVLRGIPGGFRW